MASGKISAGISRSSRGDPDFVAPNWRDSAVAVLFSLAALGLFLFRLGDPAKLNCDETHYVPASRILMALADLPNPEHPPLGKWLIGLGIVIGGDNPFGWRIMSAIFGTVLVGPGVMAARWLFGTRSAATMTGVLLLASPMLFVQSRIAMLDIFMASFLMLAFWMLIACWRQGWASRRQLVAAATFLGCAVACKWTAIPLALAAAVAFLVLRQRSDPQHVSSSAPVPLLEGLMWVGPFALLVYLASFVPLMLLGSHAVSLGQIIPQQLEMFRLQSSPMASHTYQSQWWQWVLSLRPMWYFYEPVAGSQRGVLLIGNPAISWGGLIALSACLYAGLRERAGHLLIIALLWLTSVAFFIVIPKPVMFYYHYFPASLLLCFAIAGVLDHFFWRRAQRLWPVLAIGFCVLLFVEFYPIISAAPLSDAQAFNRWMWLDSWR